ncbi:mucin-13-like isoform X2 [Hypanus sabinus]|uniref:mucin-13-like isoform X2 n=1 Tax=Hypanus sabinus TaxID=79690 RepID=UPI0028C38012|nr:mucin-13-like isoform X2 [Hypanus sabinus]
MLAQSVRIAVLLGIIYCLLSRANCQQAGSTPTTADGTRSTTAGSTPTTVGTTALTADGTRSTIAGSTPTTENGTTLTTMVTTPVTTGNTTVTTAAVITSTPELGCSMINCGANAICKHTFNGYICECAFNYYRENDTCVAGKTFSGEVTLEQKFTEEMKNEASEERKKLHNFITDAFKKNLGDLGYKSTIIYSVRKGSVIADVTNTFGEDSTVNESIIAGRVQESFKYITIQGCNSDKCNKDTADCYQPNHGLAECICKTGFYKISSNETKCTESCALKCKGANQHCVQQNGIPVCECRPGYKDNSGNCESCPFGYNGINCEDGYQIAILVTGVVCGVVILILGIVLIYLCVRLRRNEPDEQEQPILGSMSSESRGNSQFPSKIPRIGLGNLTNGSSNYFQSDSNQFNYSRRAPWNELSEFHQRDSYPNRNYDYRR